MYGLSGLFLYLLLSFLEEAVRMEVIKMNWIPCRERLPKSDEPEVLCLVTYQDYDVFKGKWDCRKVDVMPYLTKHGIWNTKVTAEE